MSGPKIPVIIQPPPSVAQLAVLMLDGSGSMSDPLGNGESETKAHAVLSSTVQFVDILKSSRIRDSFWLSVFGFSTNSANMLPVQKDYVKITEIKSEHIKDPSASLVNRKSTDIAQALEKARSIANSFRHDPAIPIDGRYRRSVVILLSDGLHNSGDQTAVVQNSQYISNQWPLCTVAFGHDADSRLLKQIASNETHFLETSDPKKLREFFIHSSTIQKA